MSVVAEGPIVQLCKLSYAALDAAADGGGPEHTMLTELDVACPPLGQKSFDLCVRSASKEKDVIKIALPRKLGLSLGKAGVVRQLARRK